MERAYFQYYETFETVVRKFETAEEREHLREAIISYGFYGTEPDDLNDREELVWDFLKELIDDQKHRREVNRANREARKKSRRQAEQEPGETPDMREPEEPHEEMCKAEIDNIQLEHANGMTVEQIAKVHMRPAAEIRKCLPKVQRFTKPTPDQVQEYCDERKNGITGQQFCDFYESKGWKVGNAPMKDWKAAVRNWETRERNGPPARGAPQRQETEKLTF